MKYTRIIASQIFQHFCILATDATFPLNKQSFRRFAWSAVKTREDCPWVWGRPRASGDLTLTYATMWKTMVCETCLEEKYSVTSHTMPEQFFFIKLDTHSVSGYDACVSGLLHNRLVIRKNNVVRSRPQQQNQKTTQAALAPGFKFNERYRSHRCHRSRNMAIVADTHTNYACCLFEHTTACQRFLRVHPPNMCRDAVHAIKSVLRAELHFHDSPENTTQTFSAYPPVVIAGRTIEDALLSVAHMFDTTDYENVAEPRERAGGDWMRKFWLGKNNKSL